MNLLTKKQVMGYLKAPNKVLSQLAHTAYDALVKLEEMQDRIKVFIDQIASLKQEIAMFADAKTDQMKIDELNDQVWRLRDQIEAMPKPLIAVLVYRDGRVHVYGKRGQQSLAVVPVPDLPESMRDEREQLLMTKLGALHAEAIAKHESKLIAEANTNQALTLTAYQYLKAYRQVHLLAQENAALKLMLQEETK
jgi:uncharacterized small protein (DUF1192 family)